MKTLAVILMLVISGGSFAQPAYFKFRYHIDSSNHGAFYKKAQYLIELNNTDSALEATNILRALFYYDTANYSLDRYANLLDRVGNLNRSWYESILQGQWKFEWSGSNWGTDKTSKELNKTITFIGTKAFFYLNDTLQRATNFILTNSFSRSRFTAVNYFYLIFEDNNEKWIFHIYKDGCSSYVRNGSDVGLWINKMPNCVCGCPLETYQKIENRIVLKR